MSSSLSVSKPASSVASRFEAASLLINLGILLGLAFPPLNLQQPSWVVWLLLWSPGVLMLLGERLAARPPATATPAWAYPISLLFLWAALILPPGMVAGVLAGCWLIFQSGIAAVVVFGWMQRPVFSGWALCLDGARVFPAIGAAWLVANRLNYMPFGFDALIVLLTAAHFHHAGFTLPLMAGLCGKALPGALSWWSCRLILAGVPLVAAGITSTHFKVLPWLEPVAVCVLVAGALGVALLQIRMAFQKGLPGGCRALFLVSGISLFSSMLLALSFGLRSVLPEWALPMPAMWAVHGTLNTFGFGLCGVLAWRWQGRTCRPQDRT